MLLRSFVAVFVTCFIGMAPSAASISGKRNLSADKSPLRLTLTVLGQQYCAAFEDTDMLHTRLLLTFTNVSSQPLILSRGSKLIFRTLVSKNLEDAAAGKHELDAVATLIISAPLHPPTYGKTPSDAFAILPPGGTFETTTFVSLEVSRTDEAPSHAIRPGLHVLQIVVSTWTQSAEQATELATRWAKSGRLWHTAITSEPVVVRVDSERSVEDCSKYAGLLAAAQQDPNAVEAETGLTALMAAIDLNDSDLFDNLLARGANVNAAAPGGMTALFLAAGRESIYVKRLIELGASVNVRSLAGQTPLTVAIRDRQIENVKLLIAAGASVNTPGEDGKTPLKLASELLASMHAKQQFTEIIELLKRTGAKE
jgi:FOG: Ankyrin repeat